MSDDLFNRFVDLVYQISGIRFTSAKAYFLSSKLDLRRKAFGLQTLEDYYRFLQQPHAKTTEYPLLLNEITINETFFYRNQPQLTAFETQILQPMIAEKRKNRDLSLRFLSAACSTGDEPYTFALQLESTGIARDFKVDIVGADISRRALDSAKAGVFSKYAIRNIPPPQLQRFFTPSENDTHTINPDIRKKVTFTEGNLQDGTRLRTLGKFDIIFCRNVLIYFDEKSKEQVLMNLASLLNDTGYLLLGHSENIYSQRHIFKQVKEKMAALAYQKAPPGTPKL